MRFQHLQFILRRSFSTLTALRFKTASASLRSPVISLLKGRQRSPIFRTKVLKSASFSLGSFFGLRSAQAEGEDNHVNSMSFPDERSEDEWRAVLSPGMPRWKNLCISLLRNHYRAIPRASRKRHRTAFHLRIRQTIPRRRSIQLCRLRRTTIPCEAQV